MSTISKYDLDQFDPEATGLIVVDLQNAFVAPDGSMAQRGFDVTRTAEIVPRCVALADFVRERGCPVFFTRLLRRPDGRDAPRNIFSIYPSSYDDYGDTLCLDGSSGAEYVDEVTLHPADYEVTKRNQDAFYGTSLDFYLRGEGIETVLVCGVTTNVCVESTIRGAHERGFDVVMVEDCCGTDDKTAHESTVRNVEYVFGATATAAEIRGLLPETP